MNKKEKLESQLNEIKFQLDRVQNQVNLAQEENRALMNQICTFILNRLTQVENKISK